MGIAVKGGQSSCMGLEATILSGMAGRIAVVDEHNRFVRWEDRREIHIHRLVHRSVHVAVFDHGGRLVIQRRNGDKDTYPLHWDMSCAGHVEESDYTAGPDDDLDAVYAAVARRELEEELGVRAPLELLGHFAPEPGVHYEQLRLFRVVSDGPYVLQPEEVAEIRPVTRAGYSALAEAGEPITHALAWFVAWMIDQGSWA